MKNTTIDKLQAYLINLEEHLEVLEQFCDESRFGSWAPDFKNHIDLFLQESRRIIQQSDRLLEQHKTPVDIGKFLQIHRRLVNDHSLQNGQTERKMIAPDVA